MTGTWASLLETEHCDMIQNGAVLANRLGNSGHTSLLRLLIRDSLALDEIEKKSCEEALARVQWVFTAHDQTGLEGALSDCFCMVFSWPLAVSPEFVGLLEKRKPEALLVLANFAVLLHWCRHHWIFGQVGYCLLESIVSGLGQEWDRWLHWPRLMVKKPRLSL
ncbi:uncharacterized protein FRV6_16739 [Fusarium oxysporum]|uniref:Uncharacterized protein n=1 Tax=Fusarium oxysporum TaxID=5507 RepID=A0A2H3U3S7_FUSOX|nr:uncharacterized protein FRV6_16739 [Fusarium oxysporum]